MFSQERTHYLAHCTPWYGVVLVTLKNTSEKEQVADGRGKKWNCRRG